MTGGSIASRLAALRRELPPGVTLVAVSKGQPAEAIREAYAAGQRDFGENYVQEWRQKADALAALPGIAWHLVGGLQTNKVKYLVGRVALVHAVDREDLGAEISRRFGQAGQVARVLVEVNLGGEGSKAGCAPGGVPRLVEALRALPALEVAGLMCIPPPDDPPRPHFARLRALAGSLGLGELSMGMSSDWREAVAEGATLVRVGTAIFGERAARVRAP